MVYVNPIGDPAQTVEFDLRFEKTRLAEVQVDPIRIKWDRETLEPTYINASVIEVPGIQRRGMSNVYL